ncbi:MAG TPA: class I SAM-dependent methyltransferase [Bacillota bacterium]|jgi:cyclopropane fatty-acyl-phospholipid synthase-like methyltransferase|uniref:Methyltransferase n=1 Tax=anaerobic digester metagenome TaxID=1263854 RepID=A0A485M508_9ZZZZ|nr:class I SAM-dependent methyltransferase [Bacillota bacterium]HQE10729.1 class I SAM-dependent methyltransferase [Bacillota bacterium]
MDMWKFFDITHRHHRIFNPLTVEKLDELCALAGLSAGGKVLDIACGKAELLVRLAGRYDIKGVGVDLSPYCIREAEEKRQRLAPGADLEFFCLDGAEYRPDKPKSFDLIICLGASWIWKGSRGTLRALKQRTRSGGLIMAGE